MILTRAFYLSSYLLSLAGFTAMVAAQAVSWWLAAIVLVAYALSAAATFGPRGWSAASIYTSGPRRVWTVLTAGFLIFYLVDVLWLADSFLTASLHLLLYLMVQKLLTLQTPRDYLYLYAISFVQFLAASGLTTDLWYAGAFAVYLLAATWTLVCYHLLTEVQGHAAVTRDPRVSPSPFQGEGWGEGSACDPVITGRFFVATNLVAVGAFILTLAFFFLIPRVGAGFFQRRTVGSIRVTGFSEKVDLGAIGAIKTDSTVVMRVTLPDHPKGPNGVDEAPYWRGMAFDAFDGMAWRNTLPGRTPVTRSPGGQFMVEDATAGPLLRQEFFLEPIQTDVLFAADRPVAIEGRFAQLQRDEMGGLSMPSAPVMRIGYTAYSRRVPSPPPLPGRERGKGEGRAAGLVPVPPEVASRYLQLPDLDPRITALAREAVAGAETAGEKVRSVERFLARNYQYSLAVESSRVEDFLLRTKTGYCEQYATAAILMLRVAGVPTRMVSGFLSGEWNAFGGYYTVRQRDAHTWVEVYLPETGWTAFDPTPAGPAPPETAASAVFQAIDALRLRWDRYVIRYAFLDQVMVAMRVRDEAEGIRAMVLRWIRRVSRPVLPALPSGLGRPLVLGGAGILIVLAIAWRLMMRAGVGGWRPSGSDGAPAFYRQMLRLLQRRGLTRQPAETPREFTEAVVARRPGLSPVRDLTAYYEQVRFAARPLAANEAACIRTLLARLKRARPSSS